MSIAPSKPVPAVPNPPEHLPDHLELPEQNGEFVQNFRELPQSLLLSSAIWPILENIHPDRHTDRPHIGLTRIAFDLTPSPAGL